MDLSEDGDNLIKGEEQLALIPYRDGGGVWTWAWGHAQGPHEEVPESITIEQAQVLFDHDTSFAVADVNGLMNNSAIPQKIFDGLVSFLFNIGITQLRALPHRTMDAIIAQDWPLVAKLMLNWVHDNGQYVQGLYNRRMKEITYMGLV